MTHNAHSLVPHAEEVHAAGSGAWWHAAVIQAAYVDGWISPVSILRRASCLRYDQQVSAVRVSAPFSTLQYSGWHHKWVACACGVSGAIPHRFIVVRVVVEVWAFCDSPCHDTRDTLSHSSFPPLNCLCNVFPDTACAAGGAVARLESCCCAALSGGGCYDRGALPRAAYVASC